MADEVELNIDKVRSAVKSHPEYLIALRQLSIRNRESQETSIERFKAALDTADRKKWKIDEVIAFFKVCEAAGAGKLVQSTAGKPPKFKWKVGLISFGEAALSKSTATVAAKAVEPLERAPKTRPLPRVGSRVINPTATMVSSNKTPTSVSSKGKDGRITVYHGDIALDVDMSEVTALLRKLQSLD